ncbi:phenol degradation protein meta [Mesorhizobium erdmanii]|uniref:Phenol degradation protein meta n=3 Tax=Mesorhizobium TaxID=68287 RepID=A0A3M9XEU2_9HYPH|nr:MULTISPECIES: transporter [Mesorhizobium]RNJ46272.1 phenol degradation protein meta [Mesorhizobium japonicum]RXT47604.1 phenol degradation protein meta [Mesorhizobium erdmanii]
MLRNRFLAVALGLSALLHAGSAFADEGGISFWLPGQYGSFAATPTEPGWSWTTVYYRASLAAGSDQQFPRGGQIDAGLDANANLVLLGPAYTFADPMLGGQLALSMMAVGGRNEASVDAVLTGPNGNRLSGSATDGLTALGDLYPTATLKWNRDVHNYMAYVAGDIPVGSYEAGRLANLGIGHGAIDVGGGYTYFNPATGREASAVLGFTYNLENPDTNYQSGVDMHIDWGAAQFLNEQFFVGVVGYYYQQITGDSGSGATLGDFKSRVAGIGPQVGYLFPVGDKMQGALNVKAYWEFGAQNRPEGWNFWAGFALSPAVPKKTE